MQYKIKHYEELESVMELEHATMRQMKGSLMNEWLKVLEQAIRTGVSVPRDELLIKLFLNQSTA
jgi:SWI/SNF related-matrix-associated actin-dependent regulator of chromatin subfamily C